MAGLTRALRIDAAGFTQHVSKLLSHSTTSGNDALELWADVRANAYGHGLDLIVSALRRVGFTRFLFDDTDLDEAASTGILDADEMYGLAENGRGFTTFVGEVVNVKQVSAGRRISYGYTYATSRDTTLALVGLGYADGAARRASSLCDVSVMGGDGSGNRTTGRIAGRIAMDQLVVDLNGPHDVPVGAEAILWSSRADDPTSVADWSSRTGIPALALISNVGYRVAREVMA